MAERPKIPSSCPEDGAGWVGLSAGWNFSTYIVQFCLLKLSEPALISLFQFYDGFVKSVRPINVRRLLASDSEFVRHCKEEQMQLVGF